MTEPGTLREPELLALLERCKQREYNGFEPDNQSKLYHDIDAALTAPKLAEAPSTLRERLAEWVLRVDKANELKRAEAYVCEGALEVIAAATPSPLGDVERGAVAAEAYSKGHDAAYAEMAAATPASTPPYAVQTIAWTDKTETTSWKCKARAANTGANDPQDCDWPTCGCDPYADKVIEALQESGLLPTNKPHDVNPGGQYQP